MTEDIAASLGLQKDRGEIVARVEPGEAAARAGIRPGDVIVKVNGQEVTPENTLSYRVANLPIGPPWPLERIRTRKPMPVPPFLCEWTSQPKRSWGNQRVGKGGGT